MPTGCKSSAEGERPRRRRSRAEARCGCIVAGPRGGFVPARVGPGAELAFAAGEIHCRGESAAKPAALALPDPSRRPCVPERQTPCWPQRLPSQAASTRATRLAAVSSTGSCNYADPMDHWSTGPLAVRRRLHKASARAPETTTARRGAGHRRSQSAQCSTSEAASSAICCSPPTARMFCARSPLGPCTNS